MTNRSFAGAFLGVLVVASWASSAKADRIDRLIRDLGYSNYKVRVQSAYALGRLKDKRAVPALVGALGDSEYAVRGTAAIALGLIRSPDAVDSLIRALSDEEEFVQAEAAKALGAIADKRAFEALMKTVEDRKSGWKVRLEGVRALGTLRDKRAITVLATLFEEEFDTGEFGDEIKRALRKMKSEIDVEAASRLLAKEDGDKNERARAAYLLGITADPRALDVLSTALGDKEVYVRFASARALIQLADVRAIPALSRALDRESHPRLRHYLYLALSELRRKTKN